jgi:hypothetical protein
MRVNNIDGYWMRWILVTGYWEKFNYKRSYIKLKTLPVSSDQHPASSIGLTFPPNSVTCGLIFNDKSFS